MRLILLKVLKGNLGRYKFCHELHCGGHFAGKKTAHKVLQSGFFWPNIFKDADLHAKSCDRCQRVGNISKRDEMSLTNNQVIQVFDVWGIDFMGPFPMSFGKSYILVAVHDFFNISQSRTNFAML